jgi:signal transduction histidine kinase/CheY-like chemotaxis protein/HPt (histidine-containing phosphotransfer) domain-containing protein
MLFQLAVVGLIVALVATCGWMLVKIYGSSAEASPLGMRQRTVGGALRFPDALMRLLDGQLRELSDPAIRFALQSRIDAAIPMGDSGKALALLEVFFDLERLDIQTVTPEAVAQLGDGSDPVVGLLQQRPAVRETMLAKQLTDQLFRQLTSVVGAKRAALDFQTAGLLPIENEHWARWYSEGEARDWFTRIAEQARGIGSGNMVALIEAAAREIGQTVPLVCFPNLLAIVPVECLTPEKSYAAGRSALWKDFLQTRLSLQASENALRRLNDELEQRVQIRTAELESAKARAEDSERAKDRFLANMSHEIRTPMHGVLGMLDLLRSSELTTVQAEQAAVMQRSCVALLDVVNDILDFSTIQREGLTLESTEYSPADIAADTISLFQPRVQTNNVAMHLVVEEVPQRIVGDPSRMRQVLGNLVGNAVKFTHHGSITLSLHGDKDRGRLLVEVADSGIGIPAAAIQRIFDPFSQADESTRRHFGGTGLGLTICSELVKAMGGQLAVQSTPGKGSTFHFEIPMNAVERAVPARTGTAPYNAALPVFPVDVLLAEDNPVNQLLAKAQLASLGCRVQLAVNGVEATQLYSNGHYDIVLMDCHMPELDGYQATLAIRTLERERGTRRVPIIAATATVLASERELCQAAGMDDFLSKPYGVQEIAAMLERWLPVEKRAGATAVAAHGGESTAGAPSPPIVSIAAPLKAAGGAAALWAAIDRRVFDDLRRLQRSGNPDLIERVVSTFRTDAPLRVRELRAAIRRSDAAGVQRAAHTLKSVSANVGAVNLSTLCGDLEGDARQGSLAGAQRAADAIDRALSEVMHLLDPAILSADA